MSVKTIRISWSVPLYLSFRRQWKRILNSVLSERISIRLRCWRRRQWVSCTNVIWLPISKIAGEIKYLSGSRLIRRNGDNGWGLPGRQGPMPWKLQPTVCLWAIIGRRICLCLFCWKRKISNRRISIIWRPYLYFPSRDMPSLWLRWWTALPSDIITT